MNRPPKCPLCPKPVSNIRNPLVCSICKLIFHKKCCPLNLYELSKLSNRNLDWNCDDCMNVLFPFTSIDNSEFHSLFKDPVCSVSASSPSKSKCGNCSRRIYKNFPFFFCNQCSKNYHLKCSNDSKETYINSVNWQCDKCVTQELPFSCINDNDFNAIRHGFRNNFNEILTDLPGFTIQSLLDKMPSQKFSTDEFLSSSINSKYYSPTDFIDAKFSKNSFTMIHLNIASLQCHIDELRTLLSLIGHPFDVVCITETRLHDDKALSNIHIEGYDFVHTPTPTRCGGAGIYIKSSLEYEQLKNHSVCHENISESIFIEIKNNHKKNLTVGCIYRHHTPIQTFISEFFNPLLTKITKSKKVYALLGDFNIDLSKYGTHAETEHFYDLISSNGFRPLILQPTRVTSTSATLIDNIFINNLDCFSKGGNITCSISDHFLQFSQIDVFDRLKNKDIPKYARNWRIFNKNEFESELKNIDWNEIINSDIGTDRSFNSFYYKIEKLIDEMAPVKKLTKKEIGLKKSPWITYGILKSIHERDLLYKKFTMEKDPLLKSSIRSSYNSYRNRIVTLLRISKKQYYSHYFEEHNTNIKKTWEAIRNLINVSKKSSTKINKIIHNDQHITDNKGIADTINSFYTNIGSSIEAKIPQSKKSFQEYLGNSNFSSIYLNECSLEEVTKLINDINISKSCGPFSIPTKILKEFSNILSPTLAIIINKSIMEGVFPKLLKDALVCPIFKKSDKTKCANYRPISLLSNLSKVFERIMYNRIEHFLDENNILYDLQFGFRKKHSTNHALLSIIENIRNNMDNKIFSCGVFVDLEKAFDTVKHSILISKLHHYGIQGISNDWIRSYLSSRTQRVSVNGATSEVSDVTCGVPQGSILGPLLFIIYINDMHHALLKSMVYHFADDTNLIFSHKDPTVIAKVMNSELAILYDWLCANRLSLNVGKTEFTIFRPPSKSLENRITLTLAGKKIFESKKVKYLGIILDDRLTWKIHISELCKKLGRTVGMLFKIRYQCNKKVLRSLYFSLFESHLSYGLPVWGSANQALIQKLFFLQKKAIRAITFSDFRAHSSPLFKKLNVLKVHDLFQYQVSSIMWDFDHYTLPHALNPLFNKTRDTHSYGTRFANADKLTVERVNTSKYGLMSFKVIGANKLNELKDCDFYNNARTKQVFLNSLKENIISNYE